MKYLISTIAILISYNLCSQNTIPTTTCTGAMKINDSLNVNKDITALGDITSKGEVIATDTMRAQKDILIDGNAKVGGDLTISGNSLFEQDVTIKKTLSFDGTNGFTKITNGNNNTIRYGSVNIAPHNNPCAAQPTSIFTHQFGGNLQVYDPSTANTGGTVMNLQTWVGGSSIDASTGGQLQGSNLLLNYFCGNDVGICVGQNGGVVSNGKNVEIGLPSRNIQTALNIKLQNGINKGITILNPNIDANKNVFEIEADGKTHIGIDKVMGGPHTNAMLSVGGNGKIACKEVRVFNNTTGYWADFVFEKNYKLMPLKDVENYYKKFNHLPDVPTSNEIYSNGNDLAKTDAVLLQKIEELTIYVVELNKKIEALENKLKK